MGMSIVRGVRATRMSVGSIIGEPILDRGRERISAQRLEAVTKSKTKQKTRERLPRARPSHGGSMFLGTSTCVGGFSIEADAHHYNPLYGCPLLRLGSYKKCSH